MSPELTWQDAAAIVGIWLILLAICSLLMKRVIRKRNAPPEMRNPPPPPTEDGLGYKLGQAAVVWHNSIQKERDENLRLDIAAKIMAGYFTNPNYTTGNITLWALEQADSLIDHWKANPRKEEEPDTFSVEYNGDNSYNVREADLNTREEGRRDV